MSKAPAFQLYAADFYMDTITWTAEEVGAYLRLLLYEWINGPLKNDAKTLYGICGFTRDRHWKRTWDRIWPTIGPKFSQIGSTKFPHLSQYDPSFLVNTRLETEREKQLKHSETQKNNVGHRWRKDDTMVLPPNENGNTLLASSSLLELSKDNLSKDTSDHCPHQQIISLYHKYLPTCPEIVKWTPNRAKNLRARWNESDEHANLDWWEELFNQISQSRFLTGRATGNNGRPFFASLDWIVKPENFAKILEGRYHE
jgi:hypothetical protein